MSPLRDVIAAMSAETKDHLVRAGFRKRQGDIYTYDLADNAIGWVGLNYATYWGQGPLDLYPIIGVRDQTVERLLAEFTRRRYHPYLPPTVSSPLGYLLPEQTARTWTFDSLETVPTQAKRMAEAILTHGLNYMWETSSHAALIATMRAKPASYEFSYRLPIFLWLEGYPEEAGELIDRRLSQIGLPFGDIAKDYWRFADELRRRMQD